MYLALSLIPFVVFLCTGLTGQPGETRENIVTTPREKTVREGWVARVTCVATELLVGLTF